VRTYLQECGFKTVKPSGELGGELPCSSQYNHANVKHLSVEELSRLIDSCTISQNTKKLAFDELTNRNKTQIKKLRRGKYWRQRKWRRDLRGTVERR
jgi:hypothetical protein